MPALLARVARAGARLAAGSRRPPVRFERRRARHALGSRPAVACGHPRLHGQHVRADTRGPRAHSPGRRSLLLRAGAPPRGHARRGAAHDPADPRTAAAGTAEARPDARALRGPGRGFRRWPLHPGQQAGERPLRLRQRALGARGGSRPLRDCLPAGYAGRIRGSLGIEVQACQGIGGARATSSPCAGSIAGLRSSPRLR